MIYFHVLKKWRTLYDEKWYWTKELYYVNPQSNMLSVRNAELKHLHVPKKIEEK